MGELKNHLRNSLMLKFALSLLPRLYFLLLF